MTNPKAVVPRIDDLIRLAQLEATQALSKEETQKQMQARNDLTRYFERVENEIATLRRDLKVLQGDALPR